MERKKKRVPEAKNKKGSEESGWHTGERRKLSA